MEPKAIQRKTTGPNTAPIRAPNMGPVPAMFSSCPRKAFHVFIGTQSTPSLTATAGVCLSSGAKIFSVTLLYTIKPTSKIAKEINNEIIFSPPAKFFYLFLL